MTHRDEPLPPTLIGSSIWNYSCSGRDRRAGIDRLSWGNLDDLIYSRRPSLSYALVCTEYPPRSSLRLLKRVERGPEGPESRAFTQVRRHIVATSKNFPRRSGGAEC
jgi:hypothetical protein